MKKETLLPITVDQHHGHDVMLRIKHNGQTKYEIFSRKGAGWSNGVTRSKEEIEEFDAVTLWAVRLLDRQRRRSLSFIESEPASSVWRR